MYKKKAIWSQNMAMQNPLFIEDSPPFRVGDFPASYVWHQIC